MRKIVVFIVLISVLYSMNSCVAIFRGSKTSKTVLITGLPSESKVYVNNELIGKSPVNYEVKKRKEHFVKIEKEGYNEYNSVIGTRLNPVWTGISFVTGAIGFFIPTAIDFASGSVYDINNDKVEFNLEKKADANDAKSNVTSEIEKITSPAIRIRTNNREFILNYKTAVTVTTKSGLKIGSNISEIQSTYMVLAKNNTKINYADIAKMRIFPTRRWLPIISIHSMVSPIIWFACSKVVGQNSSICKRNIQEIKMINHLKKFEFGKSKCK